MWTRSSSRKAAGPGWRGAIVAVLAVGTAAPHHWNVLLQAQTGTIVLTPTIGVTPPSTIVTVNDGPGQQYDPHVSGDLVSYEDGISPASVRYFRFSTGADNEIPRDSSFTDGLADVSGIALCSRELWPTALRSCSSIQPPPK